MSEFVTKKEGLKKHADSISQQLTTCLESFTRLWKQPVHFNPVESVVASIASQEVLKMITAKDAPEHGFFLYDAAEQRMDIEKV